MRRTALFLLLAAAAAAFPSPASSADPLRGWDELSSGKWERTVEKEGSLVILWHHSMRDQKVLGGRRPSELAAEYLQALGAGPAYQVDLRSFTLSAEKDVAAHLSLPSSALQEMLPLVVEYQEGRPVRLAWFDREQGAFTPPVADFRSLSPGHWLKKP